MAPKIRNDTLLWLIGFCCIESHQTELPNRSIFLPKRISQSNFHEAHFSLHTMYIHILESPLSKDHQTCNRTEQRWLRRKFRNYRATYVYPLRLPTSQLFMLYNTRRAVCVPSSVDEGVREPLENQNNKKIQPIRGWTRPHHSNLLCSHSP